MPRMAFLLYCLRCRDSKTDWRGNLALPTEHARASSPLASEKMKRFPRSLLVLGAAALLGAILGVSWLRTRGEESPAPKKKKLLILGIDGMDPELLRQYMKEGKMPNFAALAARGSVLNLPQSTPPQSPVAWANLITGMNPGGHGIFYFIHLQPPALTPS